MSLSQTNEQAFVYLKEKAIFDIRKRIQIISLRDLK